MATTANNGAGAGAPRESRSSQLYQEAKGHRARLKDRLKKQSSNNVSQLSSSPEVDFARRELRNVYLKLLFSCTFTSRAKGADSSLWADTTYELIAIYRARISELDKQVRGLNDEARTGEGSKEERKKQAKMQSQKASALLRLRAAFREFLGQEEEWWRELAGRVVRVFNVEKAKPRLMALGIPCEPDNPASGEIGGAQSVATSASATGMDRITLAARDDPKLVEAAQIPANEARLIEMIHKALVSCGDLARYRELYRDDRKDPDEKPMAAGRHAPARGGGVGGGRGGSAGRGQRGGASSTRSSRESSPKPRDYSRAETAYEQARLLLPDNGSPSNQLAVLASYKGDVLSSIYYYYRALCVKSPFESAKGNLEATYRKSIERWLLQGAMQHEETRALTIPPLLGSIEERTTKTMQDIVVLHGLLYHRCRWAASSKFAPRCIDGLSSLLVDRALQADSIVRVVVTAIASHYTARLWRTPKAPELSLRSKDADTCRLIAQLNNKTSAADAEHQILVVVLATIRVLVEVGASETREALESRKRHPPSGPGEGGSASVARNITAVFRRTLPALRIASKWLKSHLEHIQRSVDQAANDSQNTSKETNTTTTQSTTPDEDELKARQIIDAALIDATRRLWVSYVDFVNIIRFAFPFDALPSLGTVGQSGATPLALEEDSDMSGFAPMRKAMLAVEANPSMSSEGVPNAARPATAQTKTMHPNEEHLIRIADILIDAKVVAESEDSPIAFEDENNTFIVSSSLPSQLQSSLGGAGTSTMGRSSVVDSALVGETSNSSSGSLGDVPLRSEQQTTLAGVRATNDDEKSEIASESTEDVVELAMRAVDERRRTLASNNDYDDDADDDDDDDGEVILIPSSARTKKTSTIAEVVTTGMLAGRGPLTRAQEQKEARKELRGDDDDGVEPRTPGSRASGQFTLIDKRTDTPPSGQQQSPPPPMTAQNLLLQVLNGPGPIRNDENGLNRSTLPPSPIGVPPGFPMGTGAAVAGSGSGLPSAQSNLFYGGIQSPHHHFAQQPSFNAATGGGSGGSSSSPLRGAWDANEAAHFISSARQGQSQGQGASLWGGGPAAFGSVGALGPPYSPMGPSQHLNQQQQQPSSITPSSSSSPSFGVGPSGQLPRPHGLHSHTNSSSPFSPPQAQPSASQQQQQQSSPFGWDQQPQSYAKW